MRWCFSFYAAYDDALKNGVRAWSITYIPVLVIIVMVKDGERDFDSIDYEYN